MRAPIKSAEEFETVFAFAAQMNRPEMYRLMLLMSVKLGLRPMEIAGLETSWFRDGELRIPLGHSKRKSGRSLPISSEITDALNQHMKGATGRVFRNAQGEVFAANGISEAIRRMYKMAGVKGSCYSGRRTLATNLVDKGVNIAVVQQVLGHSNLSTTAAYIQISENMIRKAMFED